eukprot:scaffold748_cov251-Pinguiococcus_pyrenoidosus.AAC.38
MALSNRLKLVSPFDNLSCLAPLAGLGFLGVRFPVYALLERVRPVVPIDALLHPLARHLRRHVEGGSTTEHHWREWCDGATQAAHTFEATMRQKFLLFTLPSWTAWRSASFEV